MPSNCWGDMLKVFISKHFTFILRRMHEEKYITIKNVSINKCSKADSSLNICVERMKTRDLLQLNCGLHRDQVGSCENMLH